eukprot:15476561-Alexandrium_andersonii.AAC.1
MPQPDPLKALNGLASIACGPSRPIATLPMRCFEPWFGVFKAAAHAARRGHPGHLRGVSASLSVVCVCVCAGHRVTRAGSVWHQCLRLGASAR